MAQQLLAATGGGSGGGTATLGATAAAASASVSGGGRRASHRQEALSRAAVMSAAVRDQDFAGVVLVSRRSWIVYRRALGLASIEHRVPVTFDTKFKIFT